MIGIICRVSVSVMAWDVNLFYLVAQLLHDLHVKRFEAVSVGINEVEAAVNTIINNVLSVETTLIPKIPESIIRKILSGWITSEKAEFHSRCSVIDENL